VNKLASAFAGVEIKGAAYLLYGYEHSLLLSPSGLTGAAYRLEGRILYYQLRPEFVRNYSTPLSSDAVRVIGLEPLFNLAISALEPSFKISNFFFNFTIPFRNAL